MGSSFEDVRNAEFALVTGFWPKEIDQETNKIIYDTIKGNYKSILESHKAVIVSPSDNELVQLCVGISLLHSFIQANWTGPDLDYTPSDLVSDSKSHEDLNSNAIISLSYGGEPAYHLASHPILLRWSLDIFNRKYTNCITAPWWRLRAGTIHQYILDEPAPFPSSIFDDLNPLMTNIEDDNPDLLGRLVLEIGLLHHHYGNDRVATQMFVRAARTMDLRYELTGALGKRTKFQQNDISQLVLLAKSRDRVGTSGSRASTTSSSTTQPLPLPPSIPQTLPLNDDTLLEQTEFTSSIETTAPPTLLSHIDPANQPPLHPLDQCILLCLCLNIKNTSPQHGLTAEQMHPYISRCISHPQNWSVHTMALLLRSRLESTRTRTVERSVLQLQALIDQMSASDSTVDERLEYIHDIPMPNKWQLEREVAQRYLSLGVTRSALAIFERLEMWEDVVKCHQSLEHPDRGVVIVRELIAGQKEEVEHVVAKAKTSTEAKASLIDKTRLAKLYCLLGDLEPEHALEHYMQGWSLSNNTSSRAARSLGMLYFTRGEYEQALQWLRHAARINPLLVRVWFVLGCTAVRMENWNEAREAFARVVSIDEEDGESWSNLASAYLRLRDEAVEKEKQESNTDGKSNGSVDERKIPLAYLSLAHRALQNGLKHSFENWRMWNNYMLVSLEIGDTTECIRALRRIAEIRAQRSEGQNEREVDIVDLDILTQLVDSILQDPMLDSATQTPYIRLLASLISDTLIPLIPALPSPTPSGTRALYCLHILHARLLTHQKQYSVAIHAHMDAYRASLGADITPDLLDSASANMGDHEKLERVRVFEESVRCVIECIEALKKLGPLAETEAEDVSFSNSSSPKKLNWSFQTRSIFRNFLGRMKDVEDEDDLVLGWRRLREAQSNGA
ncbi:hypothetical protein Clacol_001751 [Clathrus columnatus]|uniref:TPR-like protein n=1 Tax=Clathrus columnatus TaxID=1419009 RepID=A0AAV5A2Q9_9AGAM|nr:hypothetical protein Clacol_001751 [Clathrus columnatus]